MGTRVPKLGVAVTGLWVCAALLGLAGAVQGAEVVEYVHLDAIGNVRAVTNGSGEVVERHDYLPYGEECVTGPCAANAAPGSGQPKRFTGKERDTETGLDYFGARYYGSKTGRFTTVDPVLNVQASIVSPQRWNRYAYGLGNPLRFVDPDGREVPVVVDGRMYNMGTEVLPPGTVAQGNAAFGVLLGVASLGVPDPADFALAALGRWAGGRCAGLSVLNSVGAAVNRTLDILPVQLQSKFKHANDFGVNGNFSRETAAQFEQALRGHVADESTTVIQGTYRGQDVTHFVNPESGLNVMRDRQGRFVSGWRLSEAQRRHVLTTGRLGGD